MTDTEPKKIEFIQFMPRHLFTAAYKIKARPFTWQPVNGTMKKGALYADFREELEGLLMADFIGWDTIPIQPLWLKLKFCIMPDPAKKKYKYFKPVFGWFHCETPDETNIIKGVEDSLVNAKIIQDDRCICKHDNEKIWWPEDKIYIELYSLKPLVSKQRRKK